MVARGQLLDYQKREKYRLLLLPNPQILSTRRLRFFVSWTEMPNKRTETKRLVEQRVHICRTSTSSSSILKMMRSSKCILERRTPMRPVTLLSICTEKTNNSSNSNRRRIFKYKRIPEKMKSINIRNRRNKKSSLKIVIGSQRWAIMN